MSARGHTELLAFQLTVGGRSKYGRGEVVAPSLECAGRGFEWCWRLRRWRSSMQATSTGGRFHNKSYANLFLSILTDSGRTRKSVTAPGSWFGPPSKATKGGVR